MTGNDEIAHLINTFGVMSKELSEYHKNLEGKIQEAREKIEATEAQLIVAQRLSATGTLAAGIAHEINNPLGGILNAAMSLKKGTLAKEQSVQYLDLIVDGLNRIQDILKKVLQSFSHKVTTQPLDLKIIIERAILLIKHRLDEHKIAIANTLPLYIPQVFGDSTELQQVFLNLLMNAIDAITADKTRIPDRKIEVFHEMAPERHGDGGATDEKTITVCIRDNGAGISEDALGRAFDMFYTTKEPGKGTGLGLSVAYNIVHNHGGKISLHRNKEKGTIAKVSLPVLRQKMETMVGK
jgi:signal transduction histidine kinase